MFIVQLEEKLFYMQRLNIQIEAIESKGDIEARRVKAMTLSKNVLLRLNIERILYEEVLRQKPELRQPVHMTNSIAKFTDLKRLKRRCKQPVLDEHVREVVSQFESLYCYSMAKSIMMSEAEQDDPKVSCMLTGYQVERKKINQTPFFGLKAFEKEGKPIDHLVSKKDCTKYLEKFTLLGRQCFLDAMAFITDKTF